MVAKVSKADKFGRAAIIVGVPTGVLVGARVDNIRRVKTAADEKAGRAK